jgi:hypothetical protein
VTSKLLAAARWQWLEALLGGCRFAAGRKDRVQERHPYAPFKHIHSRCWQQQGPNRLQPNEIVSFSNFNLSGSAKDS